MTMRGKHIAILESRLGRQLVDLVAQRGAVAFHAPALAELPDLDPQAIAALVRSLREQPGEARGVPDRGRHARAVRCHRCPWA